MKLYAPLALASILLPFLKQDIENAHSATLNNVQNKIPTILEPPPSRTTVETGLSLEDKVHFEHLFGQALRETSPVKWITNRFLERMTEVLRVGTARMNGTSPEDMLLWAYGGSSRHDPGYGGPTLSDIQYMLSDKGNLREKWQLLYRFSHNQYFDSVFIPICEEANKTQNFTFIKETLGMNAGELIKEYGLIKATKRDLSPAEAESTGHPLFGFPSYQSWARFNFDGPEGTWNGTRSTRQNGCVETSLMSNDEEIQPPLSPRELLFQCGPNTTVCKLAWYKGQDCYNMVECPFAKNVSGYITRAKALDYRYITGPSATTANIIDFANLLGFDSQEIVLIRLAMAAWMIPHDDHSMFEILLGADSFLPAEFRMVQGLKDIQMFMPKDIHIRAGNSKVISFPAKEVWSTFGDHLGSEKGQRICGKMVAEARDFLTRLTGQKC